MEIDLDIVVYRYVQTDMSILSYKKEHIGYGYIGTFIATTVMFILKWFGHIGFLANRYIFTTDMSIFVAIKWTFRFGNIG